jgi:hypothetical protein
LSDARYSIAIIKISDPNVHVKQKNRLGSSQVVGGIERLGGGWSSRHKASEMLAKMKNIDYINSMNIDLFWPAAKAGTMIDSFLLRNRNARKLGLTSE